MKCQQSRRHAHAVLTLSGIRLDLLLGLVAQVDAIRAVHLLGDNLNLLGQRLVDVVQELELAVTLACLDDGLGERQGTLTALGPVVGRDGLVGAGAEGKVGDELELGFRVGAVYRASVSEAHRTPGAKLLTQTG